MWLSQYRLQEQDLNGAHWGNWDGGNEAALEETGFYFLFPSFPFLFSPAFSLLSSPLPSLSPLYPPSLLLIMNFILVDLEEIDKKKHVPTLKSLAGILFMI